MGNEPQWTPPWLVVLILYLVGIGLIVGAVWLASVL